MRECGRANKVSRELVKRRLHYYARMFEVEQARLLARLKKAGVLEIQIDDLITFEHSKLKPLTVSVLVDSKRRVLLGFKVGKIPAFGLLAKRSRKKYGYRKSEHPHCLEHIMKVAHAVCAENVIVKSDMHKRYPEVIKKFLPKSEHIQYRGAKGCVVGQGELKNKEFDPLFSVNHLLATMRARVSRLVRKTWNTTKESMMLEDHLKLFALEFNRRRVSALSL